MSRNPVSQPTRRLILGGLSVGILGLAAYRSGLLSNLLPDRDLNFEPISGMPGFRRLQGSAITAGLAPLIGLRQDKSSEQISAEQSVAANICKSLFNGATDADANTVPVAYFYDYQCPICQRLSPRIRAEAGISLRWHDLASLGPASELAARAAIAASTQGAFKQFHERLMRSRFQTTPGYIASLAESAGIDADRLIADMETPATYAQLWQSHALAAMLGLPGTPGLVVGRTVVIGDISTPDLRRLIELERADTVSCTA